MRGCVSRRVVLAMKRLMREGMLSQVGATETEPGKTRFEFETEVLLL